MASDYFRIVLSVLFTGIIVGLMNVNALQKTICDTYSYACRDGNQCIGNTKRCDGKVDCKDGSDETHATCYNFIVPCPRNTFRCAYGACVDGTAKCNGVQDCADNSDELLLICPGVGKPSTTKCKSANEFQCENGNCIPKYNICDGKALCLDGSDETITQCNNEYQSCPRNTFRCAYGGCIDGDAKCNFVDDCADGSDENYVLCNRTQPSTAPQPSMAPPPPIMPPPVGGSIIRSSCLASSSSSSYCTLLSSSGTSYFCSKDNSLLNSRDRVSDTAIIEIRCAEPEYSNRTQYTTNYCNNGSWINENYGCERRCPPLSSTSLDVECSSKVKDCSGWNAPGTVAIVACKDGYQPQVSELKKMDCLEDGSWFLKNQRCKYRCGVVHKEGDVIANINFGHDANITHHPWNTGIYYEDPDGTSLFCGGTLISPFAVLTAAHCMREGESDVNKDASKVKVAFGKFKMDWMDSEEGRSTQKVNVSKIYVYESYAGKYLNFQYDVAIMELASQVKLAVGLIMPACLAPDNSQLEANAEGKVVGWGITQTGDPSPTLQEAHLPYVSLAKCRSYYKNLITEDKFCAFDPNKTQAAHVGEGDSGSGFTFEVGNKHYIYGVTSTKINSPDRVNTDSVISTFVNVTHDKIKKFIHRTLTEINSKHEL